MKRFLHHNGLSLALFACFLLFWAGQAVAGQKVYNDEARRHGQPEIGLDSYVTSGHFWQATGENWESEFLQMGAYIVMTSFLYQKGSAESHDPDKPKEPIDKRKHGWAYRNSLFLAFSLLFSASFAVHAIGGLTEFNLERSERGEPPMKLTEFLGDAEFWFQSLQNWQSEFLAVLSIVVLTIFLRQQRSPESKSLDSPHSKTGK